MDNLQSAENFLSGVYAQTDRLIGSYELRQGEQVLAKHLTQEQARALRKSYRNQFGGTFDIIETATYKGISGKRIFDGNPSNFSHVPSHVPSNVPMFDVQIDDKLVARNLTIEAAHSFVRESVDILDIFAAIADFVVSPELWSNNGATFDTAMHLIETISVSNLYGVSLIQYAPADNDAPTPIPAPSSHAANKKKVSGKEKIRRVIEVNVADVSEKAREWSVLDIANLNVRYSGTKASCLDYMNQLLEQRIKLHTMRVIRYSKVQSYIEDVRANGFTLRYHGNVICVGTKKEVFDFVITGLSRGFLSKEACKVSQDANSFLNKLARKAVS